MRYVIGVILMFGFAVTTASSRGDQPAKRNQKQLREEAEACVNMLRQFGQVQRDFFPDGLEKAKNETRVMEPWPPKDWSWRVAILPFMEEAVTYRWLHEGSEEFKVPGTLPDEEINKRRVLKAAVAKMPEWMTLPRLKDVAGKTIYRRVVAKGKPVRFIVVESSDLVPWFRPTDDLVLAEGKPLPKMGGNFSTGFFALCGDGKVRFLPKTLTEKEIRQALLSGEGTRAIRADDEDARKEDIAELDLGK